MSRPTSAIKLGAALLAIPLLTACLGTGAPPAQNKPSTQGAPSGQRQIAVPVNLASVNRGNIASTLTYSGNIQSRASVNVLPRATGRIEQLNVDVGSRVKAGDTIAVLDRSQLEAQVRQAEARLALLQAGARPEDVQAAQAALQSAQARLDQMMQGGRAEDVASAQANLEAAQAKLNQLLEGPTDAEVESARAE